MLLLLQPPPDVDLLELVEAGEDSGPGDTSDHVDAGSPVNCSGTLVSYNGTETVDAATIFNLLSGCHHHPPFHGIDWICRLKTQIEFNNLVTLFLVCVYFRSQLAKIEIENVNKS